MRKSLWTLGVFLTLSLAAQAHGHPVGSLGIRSSPPPPPPPPPPVVHASAPTTFTPVTNPPNPSPYVHSGYYNPALNPGAVITPSNAALPSYYNNYGPYGYYGGYGYGGGGMSPDIASQSPAGYNTVNVSASTASLTDAPPAGPALVSPQAAILHQVIGTVVSVRGTALTLHSATAGTVTLVGPRPLAGLQTGELVVAWALPDGRWASITRVHMQE